MMKHANLSPSQSNMWIQCSALAYRFQDGKVPKQLSNKYAETGTLVHSLASKYAFSDWSAKEILKDHPNLTSEDLDAMKVYTDYLVNLAGKKELVELEKKLKHSNQLFGTADCVFVDEDNTLYVIDYKHGSGVEVSPEHNTQLMLYAYMAHAIYDIAPFKDVPKIKLVIVQPRFWGAEAIKEWETNPKYLKEWFEICVKPLINRVAKEEYNPGEHCKFCPLLAECPKQSVVLEQAAKVDFQEVLDEIPLPANLIDLGKALEWAPVITAWISAIHKSAFEQINAGAKVPGFKLVRKGTRRKWRTDLSQEEIYNTLIKNGVDEDSLVEVKLRSFTAIEKISPEARKTVAGLVEKPEGALTVAPESDRREEVHPLLNDFNDIE